MDEFDTSSRGTSDVSKDEPLTEERVYEIAYRCHVPLWSLRGESLHSLTHRLTLDLERRVGMLLLYLQELETRAPSDPEDDA